MGKKLIYVSNNVINHKGNETSLFFQEKFFLLEKFGEFDVVCPKGIYRCKPGGKLEKTYTTTKKERILSHIKSLFDPEWYKEFFHMIRDRKFVAASAVRIFLFSGRGLLLEKLIKKCIKDIYADVYIYSYWMSYDAYAAAKIKSRHPEITTMTRAHSYELQIQRSVANPYLMKRFICDNMDKVAFISDNSLNEFLSYYEERKENFHVCYIGSSAKNSRYVVREKKDKLTLASCSAVIPIKQLDVIIEALADWDICPVKWIHIGKGDSMQEIEELAERRLKANPLIEYEFLGGMPNAQVLKRLACNDIDIFINCSKAEGVPVSIMEAMSVGLPVIAPAINGIPELVKENCGYLFEAGRRERGLREKLKSFASLSERETVMMGKCAFEQWRNNFCLEKNDTNLFEGV